LGVGATYQLELQLRPLAPPPKLPITTYRLLRVVPSSPMCRRRRRRQSGLQVTGLGQLRQWLLLLRQMGGLCGLLLLWLLLLLLGAVLRCW
jgi:hypothetical protein